MDLGRLLKESLPFLLLAAFSLVIAGLLLESMRDIFLEVPGLLLVIPALIGLKGNNSNTLGARLGTAVHLGLIGPKNLFNRELWVNVATAILVAVVMSALTGVLAWVSTLLLGYTVSLLLLVFITTLTGTIAGTALAFMTVVVVFISLRWDLDPDNVMAPTLASFGDIVTLLTLLLMIEVTRWVGII